MPRIHRVALRIIKQRYAKYLSASSLLLFSLLVLAASGSKLFPAQYILSQDATYLISKGLSAEDASNYDQALDYYRKALYTPSNQVIYAAFAQFRISQILLIQGDLTQAALELDDLANYYPEYNNLVSQYLSENQTGIFHNYPSYIYSLPQQFGSVKDNRYHHNQTGVEFDLFNFSVMQESDSSGGGEMIVLRGMDPGGPIIGVWIKPDRIAATDIPGRLRGTAQQKVLQRLSFPEYKMSPENLQYSTINGKQALTAIADFYGSDGFEMIEYITWIYTENTRTQFFTRVKASEFSKVKTRFDQLVSTALVN